MPLVQITQEHDLDILQHSDEEEEIQTYVSQEVEVHVIRSEGGQLKRSPKIHKPPTWMKDYVGNVQTSSVHMYSPSTVSPIFPFIVLSSLSQQYISFLFNITTLHEPTTYKEASQLPEWVQAMESELAALEENKTWELVALPPEKKPIGNKRVYKLKLKPNGELD